MWMGAVSGNSTWLSSIDLSSHRPKPKVRVVSSSEITYPNYTFGDWGNDLQWAARPWVGLHLLLGCHLPTSKVWEGSDCAPGLHVSMPLPAALQFPEFLGLFVKGLRASRLCLFFQVLQGPPSWRPSSPLSQGFRVFKPWLVFGNWASDLAFYWGAHYQPPDYYPSLISSDGISCMVALLTCILPLCMWCSINHLCSFLWSSLPQLLLWVFRWL